MSLFTDDLRFWLHRQPAWAQLHYSRSLGLAEMYRRWTIWPRILATHPSRSADLKPGGRVELHTMCHLDDWLMAIWMLKSLERVMGELPPLVLHVQKTPKPSAMKALRHHFPNARIVTPEEAEKKVVGYLIENNLPRCLHWWHRWPIFQKLANVQILCESTNLIWVDSDVLFFNRPEEYINIPATPLPKVSFQEDCWVQFSMSPEAVRKELGVDVLQRVNAGMIVRSHESMDLRRIEKLLEVPALAQAHGMMEQTIQAICASAQGLATHLPKSYALGTAEMDPSQLVCRHYAGMTRKLMIAEGMMWLLRQGILESQASGVR